MSVTTAADEEIVRAKDGVQAALTALSRIVVEQCWGSDEYNADYKAALKKAFSLTLELRELL